MPEKAPPKAAAKPNSEAIVNRHRRDDRRGCFGHLESLLPDLKAVQPKAMPVILTTPEEWEAWMSVPADRMAELQRPLPDGTLRLSDEPR